MLPAANWPAACSARASSTVSSGRGRGRVGVEVLVDVVDAGRDHESARTEVDGEQHADPVLVDDGLVADDLIVGACD